MKPTPSGDGSSIGYSLSEAARRLQVPRGWLYGMLRVLKITPSYGHSEKGRIARILTDAQIERIRKAAG